MGEIVDLGFCTVELREGYMIETVRPGYALGNQEAARIALLKDERYGKAEIGIIVDAPGEADHDFGMVARTDRNMALHGFAWVVYVRDSALRRAEERLMSLFMRGNRVHFAPSLGEAIALVEGQLGHGHRHGRP